MATDYEGKYWALRDENVTLKKKKNEQEATIKRMFTKLAIIEEALKKKRQNEGDDNQDDPETGGKRGQATGKRDIEAEKFIQTLKTDNAQLRKKNQALLDKNRILEDKLRHYQRAHPSKSVRSAGLIGGSAHRGAQALGEASPTKQNSAFTGDTLKAQIDNARKDHREHLKGDLEVSLKTRLVTAEKQVVRLQHENEQLRALTDQKRQGTQRGGDTDGEDGVESAMNLEMEHLKRELRDRQAQVHILNARYEHLESTTAAEREIQEKTLEQLEHMNRQVHKLRTQLQDIGLEKEELELRVAKADEVEREIRLLREQNHRLEERMTSLCESPFISDAFQRKERIDKLFDLEKKTQQQSEAIAAFTAENQKLQVIVKELQTNIKLMKQAKDAAEQERDRLSQQLIDEQRTRQLTQTTPIVTPSIIISQVEPVVQVSPERKDAASSPFHKEQQQAIPLSNSATTIVTRRFPDVDHEIFMRPLSDEEEHSVKHLRNRIHVLQMAHLRAMRELERCEKMLHAQTNINRELALEIEELTTKKVSSTTTLQKQMKNLEQVAAERLARIQQLEVQVRQLKYDRLECAKGIRNENTGDNMSTSSCDDDDEEAEVHSLSESLLLAAQDMPPGQQLLEIWIISANFDRSVVSSSASTFILCDFYDFESQSTPLLIGSRPEYNFSATFKVTVDAFLLRYFASEVLTFELHQAIRGDFRLIGRSSVSLSRLLGSKGVIKEPALPVKLVFNEGEEKIIGTLSVLLRFAAPISEIWRVHLRSFPQDIQLMKKQVDSASQQHLLLDDIESGDARFVNELQITVFACRQLRSYIKKKSTSDASTLPCAYVHYQLLGFPDVFTNVVPSSGSPEFDLTTSKQYFALRTDACLLRFFAKSHIWFTVFDDQAEIDNKENDGVIGRCGIPMEDLAKGDGIRGWFDLLDRNDQAAGQISLVLEWKDALQIAQLFSSCHNSAPKMDLHSLDFDQQYEILRMFSPERDGRVNYRQFLLYALPNEAVELITSKIKERLGYAIDTEQLAGLEDIFTPVDHTDVEMALSKLKSRLEHYGVFLEDSEFDVLQKHFGLTKIAHENTRANEPPPGDADTSLMIHFLALHIEPRLKCAARLLFHKIRHTLQAFTRGNEASRGSSIPPSQPFEKYDPNRSGYVSRAEFKRCLSVLGFDLINIDKAYQDLVSRATNISSAAATPTTTHCVGETTDLDEPSLEGLKVSNQEDTATSETVAPVLQPKSGANNRASASRSNVVPSLPQPATRSTLNSESAAHALSAAAEFERRKQIFSDRIKAIAAANSQSLVYEHLEQQKAQKQQNLAHDPSYSVAATQYLPPTQPFTATTVHDNAARLLQRQFRRHTFLKKTSDQPAGRGILAIDQHLQRVFKSWTADELHSLELDILKAIEAEFPAVRKSGVLSRKQLGFALSKVSRLALDPQTLKQIMDHFAISTADPKADVAYKPLVHFICSAIGDDLQGRPQASLLSAIGAVYVDVAQALEVFTSVGDMKCTGRISYKRFREVLERLGLHFTSKDMRVLMILLDFDGRELLYIPLLYLMSESTSICEMTEVLARCDRFGLSKLRECLLAGINSDDGFVSREQLHSVLMEQHMEAAQFQPRDSYVLFQLAQTGRQTNDIVAHKISIEALMLCLEKVTKFAPISDQVFAIYSLDQLQRLSWNCRRLLCPNFNHLLESFTRVDWREQGIVPLSDFITIVARAGFCIFNESQIKLIARNFSAKVSGRFGINYRQFLDWTTPPPAVALEEIELKLRRVAASCAERTPSNQLTQLLSTWKEHFASADRLKTSYVSRADFARICMDILRLPITPEELRVLLFSYDRNFVDQVAYDAFLQLNWKETSKTMISRHVQFVASPQSVKSALSTLRSAMKARRLTRNEAMEVSQRMGNRVDPSQFVLCLRQWGLSVPDDAIQTLFSAFTRPDDQSKLVLSDFIEKALGIPMSTPPPRPQLSKEDNERLTMAITSAIRYSRKEMERAMTQFEEFCAVFEFGIVSSQRLWRHLERNGLVTMLSKRGAGLLIKKFALENAHQDEDQHGHEDGAAANIQISLKEVHQYLRSITESFSAAPTTSFKHQEKTVPAEGALQQALEAVKALVAMNEEEGTDLRGDLERYDPQYSGCVKAKELKDSLMSAGIARCTTEGLAPENVIGALVRNFRLPDVPDAVSYTAILSTALHPSDGNTDQAWFNTTSEMFRARVRRKAQVTGKLHQQDIATLCHAIDSAFAHFDQAQRGFLSRDQVSSGLAALHFNATSSQLDHFLVRVGIFTRADNRIGISRMEFDAFVLDPLAPLLLQRLAAAFSACAADRPPPQLPRIAELSRMFLDHDSQSIGSLPLSLAWSCIEEAMGKSIITRDRKRLQILFDVHRDGQFAFKLFLKVLSQCIAELVPTSSTSQDSIAAPSMLSRSGVLDSLYHQLSSVDFESQIEVLEESLQREDDHESGHLSSKRFASILKDLSICLSEDAMRCLLQHYPGAKARTIDYRALLTAIHKTHEHAQRRDQHRK